MGGQLSSATAKEPKILEFDTMTGLSQAFTLAQNPIRGINGGGLPWEIGPSYGELKAGGKLELLEPAPALHCPAHLRDQSRRSVFRHRSISQPITIHLKEKNWVSAHQSLDGSDVFSIITSNYSYISPANTNHLFWGGY